MSFGSEIIMSKGFCSVRAPESSHSIKSEPSSGVAVNLTVVSNS